MAAIPELLIPAGDLSKLKVALHYGADAVYMGAQGFSMRPDQAALAGDELEQAVSICHNAHKRIYIAVNNMMFDHDLFILESWLQATKHLPFDALIVSDLGAMQLMKQYRPDIPIHISTQMSIANSQAAKQMKQLGAERIILARECSLDQVTDIAAKADIETEIFIHGAMCVAVSGRCLMSAYLCGHSANRGQCKHSCRWEWQLVEEKRPGESLLVFQSDKETFLMGSKDLCLLEEIPLLVESGVQSLKVEGRMKSEQYVAVVTRVYRAALDTYAQSPKDFYIKPEWTTDLEKVSHRPYTKGFMFGYPKHEPQSMQTFNRPVGQCHMMGIIQDNNTQSEREFRLLVKNPFSCGDQLEWIGPNLQNHMVMITKISSPEGKPLDMARSNTEVIITTDQEIRKAAPYTIFIRDKITPK